MRHSPAVELAELIRVVPVLQSFNICSCFLGNLLFVVPRDISGGCGSSAAKARLTGPRCQPAAAATWLR